MDDNRPQRGRSVIGTLTILVMTAFIGIATARTSLATSAHDFTLRTISGRDLPLKRFQGKPILLVNTASRCGFTPQYKGLQSLWERYRDRGLIVVGVPSNDFGRQEPGSEQQIKEFCEVNFGVDFTLTSKQRVTGNQAHPLYRWIADEMGQQNTPRWNFHKYLIDPNGRVVAAWPSRVRPMSVDVTGTIEKLLPTP